MPVHKSGSSSGEALVLNQATTNKNKNGIEFTFRLLLHHKQMKYFNNNSESPLTLSCISLGKQCIKESKTKCLSSNIKFNSFSRQISVIYGCDDNI